MKIGASSEEPDGGPDDDATGSGGDDISQILAAINPHKEQKHHC